MKDVSSVFAGLEHLECVGDVEQCCGHQEEPQGAREDLHQGLDSVINELIITRILGLFSSEKKCLFCNIRCKRKHGMGILLTLWR